MDRLEYARKSPLFKPFDFIAVIILVIVAVLALVFAFQPHGSYVEITLNGELIYSVPLSVDRTINLTGIGVVIIENNTVRIIESTCPDHLCEEQGAISRAGQRIICLPNRLVISITGESEWDVIV